jgi:type I restriction enzyme M protein
MMDIDELLPGFTSLLFERVNPAKNESRLYYIAWEPTLFETGAYGRRGGRRRVMAPIPFPPLTDAWPLIRGPPLFDYVLTNPPFGGKEGKEAQTRFAYKTGATQVLFLQHVIESLKPGGRCGIVLDEGVLFRINETAFVQTKRKLLDDCDLWCIVSLPGGVFTAAGAGVKTNLLFFTKGGPTASVWYYDLSDIKVGKKTPFTLDRFDDFFRLLPARGESERSWTVTRAEIEARNYDLKAVNPHTKGDEDQRTPEQLLDLIEAKGREVAETLALLRGIGR